MVTWPIVVGWSISFILATLAIPFILREDDEDDEEDL